MIAVITEAPRLDESMKDSHQDVMVFAFRTKNGPDPEREIYHGVYRFDPECQPELRLKEGEETMLHGAFDQWEVFSLMFHQSTGMRRPVI